MGWRMRQLEQCIFMFYDGKETNIFPDKESKDKTSSIIPINLRNKYLKDAKNINNIHIDRSLGNEDNINHIIPTVKNSTDPPEKYMDFYVKNNIQKAIPRPLYISRIQRINRSKKFRRNFTSVGMRFLKNWTIRQVHIGKIS